MLLNISCLSPCLCAPLGLLWGRRRNSLHGHHSSSLSTLLTGRGLSTDIRNQSTHQRKDDKNPPLALPSPQAFPYLTFSWFFYKITILKIIRFSKDVHEEGSVCDPPLGNFLAIPTTQQIFKMQRRQMIFLLCQDFFFFFFFCERSVSRKTPVLINLVNYEK